MGGIRGINVIREIKGIRGINLADKDSIVSLSIINHDQKISKKSTKDAKSEHNAKEKFILSITENGYGKRTSYTEYQS